MRRKLIKQGKGALTISLPKEWIEFNNLSQGNEVEVFEEDNVLRIKPDFSEIVSSTELKLGIQTSMAYRSLIGALYRGGFDVIKIYFSNKKIIASLQKAVDSLYGFEIFDIDEKSCVIKSIYGEESTDIASHIRRIIYTISTMQSILMKDLNKNNFESEIEMLQFHNNVLKQRDLIIRIIREQKLLDNKNFPYHNIVTSLWNVTRSYYYMYDNLKDQKVTKKSLDLLKKTNSFFMNSFRSFNNLTISSYLERNKEYQMMRNLSLKILKDQKENSIVASFCLNIVFAIQYSDSSIFLLNHD